MGHIFTLPNLGSYIERGEIQPLLSESFSPSEIVAAQQNF